MKYLLLVVLAVLLFAAAPDAQACQQCKVDMAGCLQCRETNFNGAQACEILYNGSMCQPKNGPCEGAGGDEECGDTSQACVYERWAMNGLPESRPLQLASVAVIGPPAKAPSRASSL